MAKCGAKTEIYSRVCGYFRPVSNWNKGKKEEGGVQTEKKFQDPRGSGRGFCRHAAFLRLHGEYNKQWRKC